MGRETGGEESRDIGMGRNGKKTRKRRRKRFEREGVKMEIGEKGKWGGKDGREGNGKENGEK